MGGPVRNLLIAVAVVIAVALGLYAYQVSRREAAKPADAGLLAQAEAACLSNIKAADKADVGAGVKAAEAGVDATASVGTTTSQERGASHELEGNLQLTENDKIRECMRTYLQHQAAPGGAKAP